MSERTYEILYSERESLIDDELGVGGFLCVTALHLATASFIEVKLDVNDEDFDWPDGYTPNDVVLISRPYNVKPSVIREAIHIFDMVRNHIATVGWPKYGLDTLL